MLTRTLAVPKGTRDFSPSEMRIRDRAFAMIESCFNLHGAVKIDTPVFELKEVLMGKYGEDSKLIYELNDQGGQILALRYDLTVPFARYVAMNSIKQMKRYHIAKVYRRDNPAMARGRFREFYQCDFDIAGDYKSRLPDAECLVMIAEILNELKIGKFTIKVSHRGLLDGILTISGVPEDKIRSVCSSIDKLDKLPWNEVKKEIIEKGLTEEVADRIGTYVTISGPPKETLRKIGEQTELNSSAREGLRELDEIFNSLELMGDLTTITLDLSLARGLDYYTGVIYEAITLDNEVGVGSIAAGGRYDGLIGMFLENGKIPAVGFSIGIERIMAILATRIENKNKNIPEVEVTVLYKTNGNTSEAIGLVKDLRTKGISCEFSYSPFEVSKELRKQLAEADKRNVRSVILIGLDSQSGWIIKKMATMEQTICGSREEVIQRILG